MAWIPGEETRNTANNYTHMHALHGESSARCASAAATWAAAVSILAARTVYSKAYCTSLHRLHLFRFRRRRFYFRRSPSLIPVIHAGNGKWRARLLAADGSATAHCTSLTFAPSLHLTVSSCCDLLLYVSNLNGSINIFNVPFTLLQLLLYLF